MLYIFSGLPGTGKSVLSQYLSQCIKGTYLRIDTIEQTMKNQSINVVFDEGYQIAFTLASDNLALGNSVVADCVNPALESREAWRELAMNANVPFCDIEIICSDVVEHQYRIEQRIADIPTLQLPAWEQVMEREYHQWQGDRIVIDTAGKTMDQSKMDLLQALALGSF
ncbi:AAA family ATPase [Shewanella surugensis]|uniref:AAA family ATPase n=1 Tax=Shewanella surugensis TaxID=212020 RepID=A0ABT0LIJ7_9GAMM|nr:AAA family ATPase [Shewanella surugensis]MCL1127528.1 AAA family ATPase [Shewanella surugensis]